ncbi:MAG TPA: tripartite tricarboxylate transporter substrate binding protein [Xanthobacteraceae bacterium]|nr:tripartite tricarboxylate transporter substrate binding protein [Xanthobacteraceae bacterium]
MLPRNVRRFVLAAALALPLGAPRAVAQQYPTQDIHLICGFAAGSGADIIVRFIAEKMKPLAGRAIIVENKPGAGGNIATEYVARAKPDGYTIYITGASALAANMHVLKNPSVDVGKALQIVGTINKQPVMIAVRGDSPIKSMAELTAAMKAKGEKASYALANPTAKVVGAMYKEKAGLQAVEVSYRTGAEYLNDLASGVIDYAIPDNVLAVAQARAGRMRILAVSTAERMQSAPDYPTMTESGYPMDLRGWWAGLVPAGTPKPVVEQLGAWISQIVSSDEGKKFLANIASDPWVSTPDAAQAYFLQQIKQWGEYVRIAKIEPQG